MPGEIRSEKSREWEAIVGLLCSGLLHAIILSYPFELDKQAGVFYFLIQICISFVITKLIILLELGVGQLNQCGILEMWGEMVPILKDEFLDWKF